MQWTWDATGARRILEAVSRIKLAAVALNAFSERFLGDLPGGAGDVTV
jgi:hypothetical protein